MGISLWLVPAVSQALKIKRLMRLKPASVKSPSSFVDFEPHVTLASVPASYSLDDLRGAIPPTQTVIPIEFKSLEVGQKYFMSVYASVHDIGGLAALRSRLRESLGQDAVPAIAHLSLYYIDDADQDERSRIAELLRRSESVVDNPSMTVAFRADDGVDFDIMSGFDGEAIWIVRCEGPVPSWEVVERIELAPHN